MPTKSKIHLQKNSLGSLRRGENRSGHEGSLPCHRSSKTGPRAGPSCFPSAQPSEPHGLALQEMKPRLNEARWVSQATSLHGTCQSSLTQESLLKAHRPLSSGVYTAACSRRVALHISIRKRVCGVTGRRNPKHPHSISQDPADVFEMTDCKGP